MMPDRPDNPQTNPANADAAQPPAGPLPVLSYATPGGFESGVWCAGPYVVVAHGADMPDRCVICNEPPVRRVEWKMWRVSWSADSRRRIVPLHMGLCRRHSNSLRVRRFAFGVIFAGLAPIFLSGAYALEFVSRQFAAPAANTLTTTSPSFDYFWISLAALGGLCIIFAAYCFTRLRPWTISRHTSDAVWIRFTGRVFRESLPLLGTDDPPPQELSQHA
jgi:hypothetical protein